MMSHREPNCNVLYSTVPLDHLLLCMLEKVGAFVGILANHEVTSKPEPSSATCSAALDYDYDNRTTAPSTLTSHQLPLSHA